MAQLFVALFGFYFLLVGVAGKGGELVGLVEEDVKGYAPWFLGILVIGILAEFDKTRPFVGPFLGLLALNFFLRNYATIETEVKNIYNGAP